MRNFRVFSIVPGWSRPFMVSLQTTLEKYRFSSCGPTDEVSLGFMPPRQGENEALVESIQGAWLFEACLESKKVPAAMLNDTVRQMCTRLENLTGRKPTRATKDSFKDEALKTLLPRAFPKQTTVQFWIDAKGTRLYVGSTSHKVTDEIISLLVTVMTECGTSFAVTTTIPKADPSKAMTDWLIAEADGEPSPGEFAVAENCELTNLASPTKVKYVCHPLGLAEIKQHLTAGKVPTKLEMSFGENISFTLNADFGFTQVRGLVDGEGAPEKDDFDGTWLMQIVQAEKLFDSMIELLEGEGTFEAAPAAPAIAVEPAIA